jgi:hypothetical protein
MARKRTDKQRQSAHTRTAASAVFAAYLVALKAGAEVARDRFAGTGIPVVVERPVWDRLMRETRMERFNAVLEIGENGLSTQIVPCGEVAFEIITADQSAAYVRDEPAPEFGLDRGHPVWWKISGILVEISRHTVRGKSSTAIALDRLMFWGV